MSLRDKACVTGIGETAYVRGSTKTAFELQMEASLKAIRDAGLDPRHPVDPAALTAQFADGKIFIRNLGAGEPIPILIQVYFNSGLAYADPAPLFEAEEPAPADAAQPVEAAEPAEAAQPGDSE